MRKLLTAASLAAILLLTTIPVVLASDVYDDQVVFGGTYTLEGDETLDGDLVVFGGVATIEDGATVTGDVIIFGGSVEIGGKVNGDVTIFGGGGSLLKTAEIGGDLVTVGGGVSKEAGAVVHGGETSGFAVDVPDVPKVPSARGEFEPELVMRVRYGNFLEGAFDALLWSVGLGMMGLLLFLFMPEHLNRIGQATVDGPLATGALGLVTAILVPILAVVLLLTVILIPVSLLGLLVFALALLLGWLALGALIGQRMMAASVVRGTSPAVAAAIGVFVLTLVFRVLELAPGVGFVFRIFGYLLLSASLGAVVLTRFGARAYVAVPAVPPAPAVESAPLDMPDSVGDDEDETDAE